MSGVKPAASKWVASAPAARSLATEPSSPDSAAA
uniref:Uncharacterized protein n=1 Tax=Arundo donax TaxID=35708 RepID=A0A0A9CE04_ARUDO